MDTSLGKEWTKKYFSDLLTERVTGNLSEGASVIPSHITLRFKKINRFNLLFC